MSDSGGNAFGEALESMTTNTKKAIGGTIADFGKSVKNQTTGSTGISGSFTPNAAPTLQGGDLFSPDMAQKSQTPNPKPQANTNPQPPSIQMSDAKTPEEAAEIQKIEAELAQMKQTLHQKYYQEFEEKSRGRDRKTVEEQQTKTQTTQQEEMVDLQKKEEKKAADDQNLQRQQRATEVKGGMG